MTLFVKKHPFVIIFRAVNVVSLIFFNGLAFGRVLGWNNCWAWGWHFLVMVWLRTMIVSMPVIIKVGKSKRWKGYKVEDFEERKMMMENSGYSELNDIDWGYII